ncbi:MAG: PVC-type heme-binding CxxCH protein [Chthoniobacteraceae bacterium]
MNRLALLALGGISAFAAPPPAMPVVPADCPPKIQLLKPGVKLTLVAEDPQIVTPTGIDVDKQGRVWVAASHTHFRPADYPGPEHDEIVVLSNPDADGRAQTRTLFYDRTKDTMGLVLGPDGWVYLAERSRILRVKDTDGDGRGDREENIAVLKTTETYPHNGLSGLAWHPSGDLVISLGENMWKQWDLVGTDGVTLRGEGAGGGIFRCTADGANLRKIAVGFWNPFGLCVRADGEIFAAENDPGSRPPCRLLHIVEGGDYGYQRIYGESPSHPFVCWNGELRGTLPMICPSGEAPCGLQPLGGGLLASSWTDHRIDFFPLQVRGASYTSARVPIVRGSEFFRPTCVARVSGSVYYFADWVFGSYPIHQRGRVWKLEIDPVAAREWIAPAAPETPPRAKAGSVDENFATARGNDPFLARYALLALARDAAAWSGRIAKMSVRDRVTACIALKLAQPKDENWPRIFLADASGDLQFEALRWIADERLTALLPLVEAKLRASNLDYRGFEACLAALNTLNDNPRAGVDNPAMLLERVRDAGSPPRVRAFALRLLRAKPKQLTTNFLRGLLDLKDDDLAIEAVRAIARTGDESALAEIAGNESRPPRLRAEATTGLNDIPLLIKLSANADATIREEALRALRISTLTDEQKAKLRETAKKFPASADLVAAISTPPTRPPLDDIAKWQQLLSQQKTKPDPEAGERIFFNPRIAQCSNCHQRSGRGSIVGPDLTAIGGQNDEAWLLQAILDPSRDVAPQFYATALEMKDGSTFVGIPLRDGGGATAVFRDLTGTERQINRAEVVSRTELQTSVMPPGLLTMLTDREIRDLLAFLRERGAN